MARKEVNIGYTFWPYKKLGDSCMMGIDRPEGWDKVVTFSETPRTSYAEIRDNRPDADSVRMAMKEFIRNSRFENCHPQESYIRSIRLNGDK